MYNFPTYFYKSHIVKKYCVYVIVRKRIQNEDRYISLRFVSRTFESMFDLDTNINHHLQRAVRDAGRLAEDQSGPAAQLSVARFGGSMEVIVTEQDGIAIVELAGRMDATTTPEFENATRALLEAGKQRLLIDMSRLEYISSAGLRGILGLVKALKACAGKLAFCSLQPMTAEVFRISGFNAMLTVRDSRQEALAALAG